MAASRSYENLLLAPSRRTIVSVTHEPVSTSNQLLVQLIEHDIAKQRRDGCGSNELQSLTFHIGVRPIARNLS